MNKRKASAPFILATVALDALSFGIVIPVMPELIHEVTRAPISQTSFYVGAMFAVFSLMQFISSPVLGGLSDRFGRRPVLLISLSALCVNSLLWLWVHDLRWLFIMRVFAGLFAANVAAASAYLADITPPEQRARSFGLLGAMFGLGFIAGPVLGGLLGEVWIRLPFLASAVLTGINVIYGLFILPESLPRERRRAFDWRRANALGSLFSIGGDPHTLRLAFAWGCTWLAIAAQQTSFILANQMRFGWSTLDNGLAMAFGGVTQVLVQALLMRRIIARLGQRRTALAGYGFDVAGLLIYAFATSSWMMLVGVQVVALGVLAGAPVQSMLSQTAGPTRQGEMQGALGSIQGLVLVAGPLIMGTLFEVATRPGKPPNFPGAPFLLAAIVCLCAFAVLLGLREPPLERTEEAARARVTVS